MLIVVKERKRTRPTPTSVPPPQFLHSSPPPDPPEGGKGGGSCLHSILLHAADSAPHAESTTYSRKFGVRAGDT
jgi:hypothetical protein